MRFILPRLETRTKEFMVYASIRVEKTLECGMKVNIMKRRCCGADEGSARGAILWCCLLGLREGAAVAIITDLSKSI